MTDTPTPETVTIPTVEEARDELARIQKWLQDLADLQNQQASVLIRAGELRGVIATHEAYANQAPPPNREVRRATAKTAKRTAKRPSPRAKR